MKRLFICAAGAASLSGAAGANDATPMLHPIEAACIDYEMSGQLQNGGMTRCHRDYAYEQNEIQTIAIGIGGYTQTQRRHVITIGDAIYSIDLNANTGTKTINPFYANIVAALEDSSPEEMAQAFLSAMGLSPTGETKTVADANCSVYNSSMMGQVCLTGGGLMLEQVFMGNTTRAVSVSIGDGGDDANYTLYQNVPITEGPDLSNLQNLFNVQPN
jgi:hypothetical protein